MSQSNNNALALAKKRALLKQLLEKKQQQKHQADAAFTINKQTLSTNAAGLQQYPMSFAQQRLWLANELGQDHGQFNMPLALQLEGPLDEAALQACLTAMVERHQVLRTVFKQDEQGHGQAFITAPRPFPLSMQDISGEPSNEQPQKVMSIAQQEAVTCFDLSQDLMLRARLVKQSHQAVLLLTLHHIAADAWSLSVLIKELSQSYQAACQGKLTELALPQLAIEYADYATWQRDFNQTPTAKTHLTYWQQQLAGSPPCHNLPLDFSRSNNQSAGETHHTLLPLALTQGLEKICQQQGATLFMALNALLSILIARLSGQQDIVIGTPIANREQSQLAPLVGFFINNLVLRNPVDLNHSFEALLGQSKQTLLNAYEHQQTPYDVLLEQLEYTREANINPLFQIMLSLQNAQQSQWQLGDVNASPITTDSMFAKFDLTLNIEPTASGLKCAWEYNSGLFQRHTIARWSEMFTQLVAQAVQSPCEAVGKLNILLAADATAIDRWNQTHRSLPEHDNILDLFEQCCQQTPAATALVHHDADLNAATLSYSQLNQKANALAAALNQQGVTSGDLVSISLARSHDLIIAILATLKLGAAYLPVDPHYPTDRIEYILSHSQAKLMLTHSGAMPALPQTDIQVIYLDKLASQDLDNAPHHKENPKVKIRPTDCAYVIYTSGSTGKPKGVQLAHNGLINLAYAQQQALQITPDSRVLQFASIAFDAATWEWVMALSHGASLHLCDESVIKSAEQLSSLVEQQQITHATLPPVLLPHLPRDKWRSVQHLVVAGEAVSRSQAEQWSTQRHFYNAYGPSESTVCTSIGTFEAGQAELHIGKPIANLSTYVLDAYHQPVPIGVTGELYVAGIGLADGYLHQAELTAERFIRCPEVCDSMLYKTGDLVYQTGEGNLVFAGRIDHQVKIRGFRVELGEIEAQLLAMPEIKEAAIVADGEPKRLLAYLVAAASEPGRNTGVRDLDLKDLDLSAIKQKLSQLLPAYMVPSAMTQIDALPLTPNGKLDRKNLPPIDSQVQRTITPAKNEKERTLSQLWQQLLQLEQVSVTDSFFELGGDSILAIQLVSQAAKQGLFFTTQALFEQQTIRALAEVAEKQQRLLIPQQPSQGEQALLPIWQYFFNQSKVAPEHYNQSFLLSCPQGLEQHDLARIVTALYDKHDALRLRFYCQQGQWFSQYRDVQASDVQGQIAQLSLADEAAISDYANNCQASLSITKGDLLRASLITDNQQRRYLLLIIHHLVVDGVSWRILFQDIATAWQQLQRNEAIALGDKTSSLQDWSQHLQQSLPDLKQQIPFWQQQQSPALPLFEALSPALVADTQHVTAELSLELTQHLTQQANNTFNTQTSELLIGSLMLAMHRWQGITSLPLALESHGRDHQNDSLDISQTLGWFTSLYPLTLTANSQCFSHLANLIKAVKEQLRQVPQQGQGYLLLQQAGELNTCPQPPLVFNYLGQFDSSFEQQADFIPQQLDLGLNESAQRTRAFTIGINCFIARGKLAIDLDYASSHFDELEMQQLLTHFCQSLQDIIACCQQEHTARLTPSDVPLSQLTQESLDNLSQQYPTLVDLYPATGMQQGMLFHSEMDPSAYVSQIYLDLLGQFNTAVFADSWRDVFDQQAIFRTQFVTENRLQMVLEKVALPWQEVDFSELDETAKNSAFERYRVQDKARGFTIDEAPLMRLTVAKMGHHHYRLLWTNHHALLDGWSMPLVFGAVMQGYKAKLQGQHSASPIAPYKAYITWLSQQDHDQAAAFWQKHLEPWQQNSHFPVTATQVDSTATKQQYEAVTCFADYPALERFAQQMKVTVNTVLQGAWAILLQQHSQLDTLVFAETVAGRPPELNNVEQMVGLFINSLPVVIDYQQEQTIAHWFNQLHQQAQLRHQQSFLPLRDILKSHASAKELSLQSLIVFENYPLSDAFVELNSQGQAFNLANIQADEQTNFDLTLTVNPGTNLKLTLNFDSQLFDQAKGERLLSQLTHILAQIIHAPEQKVGNISAINSQEQARLQQWNNTAQTWPTSDWLSAFALQVQAQPHACAVVSEQASLTYLQLDEQSDRLASYLHQQGISQGDHVALALARGADMLVALMGVMKAGAAYVPLDPTYPAERLEYMLADSQAETLLTHSYLKLNLGQGKCNVICLDKLDVAALPAMPSPVNLAPKDSAYVIYTSGSTGNPKGVVISHHSLNNFLHAMAQQPGIKAQDSLLAVTSISFDIHTLELFLPLMVGAKVVLASRENTLQPEQLIALINNHNVTMMQATPATWKMLIDANWQMTRPFKAMCGGEPLPDSLKQTLLSQPQLQLWNMYGPTETTVWSSVALQHKQQTISVGGPIANTTFYILNNRMQALPIGVLGELYIGGHGLATQYHNRPELTKEKYVTNPFNDGLSEKLYATGDLACWNEQGELTLQGRIDQQIKIRGFRIELGEIESQLCMHEKIKEAVVVATGEPKKLVCYYLSNDQQQPAFSASVLSQYLASTLPRHMIPSAFQHLTEMPLTANGKIDRKALIERPIDLTSEYAYTPPQGDTETQLSLIWSQILGIDHASVGRDDEFFMLGGDSLALIKLRHQVRQTFGCEIDAATLLKLQRLSLQAKAIETQPTISAQQCSHEIPSNDQDIIAAPQLVKFHWQDIDRGQHLSMVQALISTDLPFNLSHFTTALAQLWQRHPALSAKLQLEHGKLMLNLPRNLKPEFETRRLNQPLDDYQYESLLAQSQANKVFASGTQLHQFAIAPTLVEVLLDDNQHFALLISQEHAFADGLSTVILNRDFNIFYQKACKQLAIEPEPLAFNYGDYQHWLNEYYPQSQAYQEAQRFWQTYAKRYRAARLPHDHQADATQGSHRQSIFLGLGLERTHSIKRLAKRNALTLNHLLYSALAHTVAQTLDVPNPSIAMILAGRNIAGTEHLVGAFADLILMASNTEQDVVETAKDIAQDSLTASQHQALNYREFLPTDVCSGDLSELCQPQASTSFAFALDTHAEIPAEWMDAVKSQQWRYCSTPGKQLSRWNWFRVIEQGEHLVLAVEYEGQHYRAATIESIINAFLAVLDSFSSKWE